MKYWRRWLLFALLGVATLLVAAAAYLYWERREAADELRQVVERLDADEPGWRLEQLEAARRVVPEKENSALAVLSAQQKLPKDWQSKALDELTATPPPARFPEDVADKLRKELREIEPAVAAARRLVDYPHGRFTSIKYAPDFHSTLVQEQLTTRTVVAVLQLDALLALHEGKFDRAWHDATAMLNAGRTLGDEPLLISQLIRIAIQSIAIQTLERTLAQGTVPDADLAAMIERLAAERDENLFLVAIRGERAGTHQMLENMENSDVPIPTALESLSGSKRRPATWWEYLLDIPARKMAYRSHARLLRFHTDVVRAAELPAPGRYPELEAVGEELAEETREFRYDLILVKLLAPALLKVAEAEQRSDSYLECALAGLAAERFRLQHERWPASLDELLEAKLLKQVPLDQYDGQPIRLRRTADGIVFYSIYKDGTARGDALDRLEDFDPGQTRVEFRLWDPDRRRQPPLPKMQRDDEP